jgi:Ca2+-transporting ATPase
LGRFNALYGALGSIVAFLLWLYLSSCVGVFGVCFCAAQTEVRKNANDHPERHPE